jgi:PAS domain S-box-containing protein
MQAEIFEQILDRLPLNVFLKDESGRICYANEATASILNHSKEALIGLDDAALFAPEDATRLQEQDRDALKSEQPVYHEEHLRIGDTRYWLLSGKRTITDPQGRRLLLGYSMDISERKAIEAALTGQKDLIEQVINTDPNLIFVKDAVGHFVLINNAVAELFGQDKEQLIGQLNAEVHRTPEENRVFEQTDQRVLEAGETVVLNESFTRPSGEVRWFRTIKKPIHLDGETKILGISTDITEQRDYESRLEKALRTEKHFIASMSHEIRTPLNSILGYLELLKTATMDEEARDFVHKANISSQHLFSLINDILDISKIEAGELDLSAQPFDLDELLLECGVIVSSRVSPDVSLEIDPPRLGHYLMGDGMRIRQIFVNLLGNAAKFTRRGFIRLEAQVLDRKEGLLELTFTVRDSGVGIAPEKLKEIFEPFKRAHRDRFEGTGLGLYLSRALAEQMGGHIAVSSVPGEGSAFSVQLPLRIDRPKRADDRLKGMQILMLSSDPALHLIGTECERLGAKVWFVALKGRSLSAIRADLERHLQGQARLDAVLVDLEEQEDRAVHLLWLLRDLSPEALLVALGGDAAQEEADAVVAKPLFLPALLDLITEQVARRSRFIRDYSPWQILMVEDVEINIELSRELFMRFFNIQLQVARSGEEAIERVRHEDFDLIFMDIQMPGFSGIEATEAIRAFNQAVPIVAISANAFAEDARVAKEAGMNDYLTKPIRKEQVAKVLDTYLNLGSGATKESDQGGPLNKRIYQFYEADHAAESARRLSELATRSLLVELGTLRDLMHATADGQKFRQSLHRLKGILLNCGLFEQASKVGEAERLLSGGVLPQIDFFEGLLVALEIEPQALKEKTNG